MPITKSGAFYTFEELQGRVTASQNMAAYYLRIPQGDPRRPYAEKLAAAELAKAAEIEAYIQ